MLDFNNLDLSPQKDLVCKSDRYLCIPTKVWENVGRHTYIQLHVNVCPNCLRRRYTDTQIHYLAYLGAN